MLAGPLISVATDLSAAVALGGTLIVSGFQRAGLAAVRAAYAGCACAQVPAELTLESGGWFAAETDVVWVVWND